METINLEHWPKNEYGRFICSPEHPMPQGATGRWEHTNAKEMGEQRSGWPSGDTVTVKCADCGKTWTEELPQ